MNDQKEAFSGADGGRDGLSRPAALEAERDALRQRLDAAEEKIRGFAGVDAAGLERAAAAWEEKYHADVRALEERLAAREYACAVKEAAGGLRFTSESAKRAFLADLDAQGLPVEDGALRGLDEFVARYQSADPDAFAPPAGAPRLVLGGGKKPTLAGVTRAQYRTMGYGDRLKLKNQQPELYKTLAAGEGQKGRID